MAENPDITVEDIQSLTNEELASLIASGYCVEPVHLDLADVCPLCGCPDRQTIPPEARSMA